MAQQDIDRLNKAASDLTREKTQIIELVTTQQAGLANAANEIAALIASNADNQAIVDAVSATLLPAVETAVTEFDVLTPENTPVIETTE